MIGWLLLVIGYRITQDPQVAVYLDNLPFPFIAFMPVTLLVFAMRFYSYDVVVDKKFMLLLCIIPSITSVIAVVPPLTWMLRTDHVMLEMAPMHAAQYKWNFWFYVHTAHSYILMMASAVFIVRQHFKKSSGHTLPSGLMVVGIGITIACNLLTLSVQVTGVDFTLVGVCFTVVVFYIAIANNPTVEYLAIARKALYNFMDMPVFILDGEDRVLDKNESGHSFASAIALPQTTLPYPFQDVLDRITECGGRIREGYGENSIYNILINIGGEAKVFNVSRRIVRDKKNRPMGSYMAMMDITQLSMMIDELVYVAEIDPLTGIANRRAFDSRCAELDIPDNLPLSLIVGDVNKLKRVNDELGHKHGDLLLKTIAGILMDICTQDAFPARLGGDEFIIVLPRCDEDAANALVKVINDRLLLHQDEYLAASIALGVITKTDPEQLIEELVQEADKRMYQQKQYDRRKNR